MMCLRFCPKLSTVGFTANQFSTMYRFMSMLSAYWTVRPTNVRPYSIDYSWSYCTVGTTSYGFEIRLKRRFCLHFGSDIVKCKCVPVNLGELTLRSMRATEWYLNSHHDTLHFRRFAAVIKGEVVSFKESMLEKARTC
jgi:hypothetical protein